MGDDSYIEDSKHGGLLGDLRVLRLKDLETANTLLKQHLTGKELTGDKTMIMEKIIQVFTIYIFSFLGSGLILSSSSRNYQRTF